MTTSYWNNSDTTSQFDFDKQSLLKQLVLSDHTKEIENLKMIEKNQKNSLIKFNVTKNEIFQLNENYKTVHRKLKLQHSVEL